MNDNTVSRCHAFLKLSKDEFCIEDGNSKFGTLVQLREAAKLIPQQPYCVQVGRTVFTILVRDPASKSLPEQIRGTDADAVEMKDNNQLPCKCDSKEEGGLNNEILKEVHITTGTNKQL